MTSISTPRVRRAVTLDRDLQDYGRLSGWERSNSLSSRPTTGSTRNTSRSTAKLGVDRLICLPGLDVPRDRRYHGTSVDDIFRSIDHLAELAKEPISASPSAT